MLGIKDWHLVLIVFGLVLIDVIVLSIYIALEGAITHFSAGVEPNEERKKGVHGVSWLTYLFNLHACNCTCYT